jgi:hypothetical protein
VRLECETAVLVVANLSWRVDDHHAAAAVGVLGLTVSRLDHDLEHVHGRRLEEEVESVV